MRVLVVNSIVYKNVYIQRYIDILGCLTRCVIKFVKLVNNRLERVYFHEFPFIVNGTHERSPVLSINVLWHAKGYSSCATNPSPKKAKLILGALTERGCARTLSNTAVVCVSFVLARLDKLPSIAG